MSMNVIKLEEAILFETVIYSTLTHTHTIYCMHYQCGHNNMKIFNYVTKWKRIGIRVLWTHFKFSLSII